MREAGGRRTGYRGGRGAMDRAIPRLRPATFAGAGIFDGRRTDARILGTGERGRTAVKDRSGSRAGGSGNNSHLGTDT